MKLIANAINAIGLALLIGSLVAPIVDPARQVYGSRIAIGAVLGAICLVAAFMILRYIKSKEIA